MRGLFQRNTAQTHKAQRFAQRITTMLHAIACASKVALFVTLLSVPIHHKEALGLEQDALISWEDTEFSVSLSYDPQKEFFTLSLRDPKEIFFSQKPNQHPISVQQSATSVSLVIKNHETQNKAFSPLPDSSPLENLIIRGENGKTKITLVFRSNHRPRARWNESSRRLIVEGREAVRSAQRRLSSPLENQRASLHLDKTQGEKIARVKERKETQLGDSQNRQLDLEGTTEKRLPIQPVIPTAKATTINDKKERKSIRTPIQKKWDVPSPVTPLMLAPIHADEDAKADNDETATSSSPSTPDPRLSESDPAPIQAARAGVTEKNILPTVTLDNNSMPSTPERLVRPASQQVLTKIQFGTNPEDPVLRLETTQWPEYQVQSLSPSHFAVTIKNARLGAASLALPSYAPMNNAGLLYTKAKQNGRDLKIDIFTEYGAPKLHSQATDKALIFLGISQNSSR